MNDFKNVAVRIDGADTEVVVAVKRALGATGICCDLGMVGRWKYLYFGMTEWTFGDGGEGKQIKTPTEILGEPLMNAIAAGYTPWFEGDGIPEGEGIAWFKGYIKNYVGPFKLLQWSKKEGPCEIIAYKKSAQTVPPLPAQETSIFEAILEDHRAVSEAANAKVLAEKVTAAQILEAGIGHMKDRATTYDKPDGERSMGATVEAFESITGHSLTEEQGWLFMGVLKMVRSQQGDFKLDNYEDGAAYFALQGESAQGRTK